MAGDGSSRIIGMVVGGGAGAFFLVVLSTYAHLPADWVPIALPGVGLAVGMGAFSFRRSVPWGLVAAVLGVIWTAFVLWLRAPGRNETHDLGARLLLTGSGLVSVFLIVLTGVVVGAGWEKPPIESDEFDVED